MALDNLVDIELIWKLKLRCESINTPKYLTNLEGYNFLPFILILNS